MFATLGKTAKDRPSNNNYICLRLYYCTAVKVSRVSDSRCVIGVQIINRDNPATGPRRVKTVSVCATFDTST